MKQRWMIQMSWNGKQELRKQVKRINGKDYCRIKHQKCANETTEEKDERSSEAHEWWNRCNVPLDMNAELQNDEPSASEMWWWNHELWSRMTDQVNLVLQKCGDQTMNSDWEWRVRRMETRPHFGKNPLSSQDPGMIWFKDVPLEKGTDCMWWNDHITTAMKNWDVVQCQADSTCDGTKVCRFVEIHLSSDET